jgi:hypothetical protein
MQQLKDYSKLITEALDKILPKHIVCAIVLGDPKTSEVSATSNMGDAATVSLLEDGIEVLKMPEETEDLDMSSANLKIN